MPLEVVQVGDETRNASGLLLVLDGRSDETPKRFRTQEAFRLIN